MSWYALTVAPSSERKVREALADREVEAWYPVEKVWRWSPGRSKPHERPLIRGYVFAVLDDRLHLAHEVGDARLLTVSGRLAILPDLAVAAFQAAEAAGLYDRTGKKGVQLRRGDRVRVTRGPFTGLCGSIARLDGARRAQVLLTMFGGSVWPTGLDQAQLEHAG